MPTTEHNDANLVAASLKGSRESFRQIVERYQTLICSIAYSATGSVSQSEDVAQETFLSAWKDLRLLREPEKLRAWLCAIARNRIYKSLAREGRQPLHNAAQLDDAHEAPACEPLPSDQAVTKEEEAILWRSLERIPELYREPLVLFYREHQSIESVAVKLELTEDAVKQRLSRGRKLLQEEVEAFVENTLRRTAPGQGFSNAVFLALPMAAGPAATAGLSAGAKGAAAAKSGFLAVWLAPLIGVFAGFAAQWMIINATTTERERGGKRVHLILTWIMLLGCPILGEASLQSLARHFEWSDQMRFVSEAYFWALWCVFLGTWLVIGFRRELVVRKQQEAAAENSASACKPLTPFQRAFVVFGSTLTIFSWFISIAWQQHDPITAAVIAGAMVVLAVWNYFQMRGKLGVAATRSAYANMTLCCATVIAFVNLRLDVWVASAYQVTVAQAHDVLPLWLVPVLTLALVLWIGVLLTVTRPKAQNA